MPQGSLSDRVNTENSRHHLWLNNGTWWCHFVLNFDFRTRRIRRSLETKSLDEAIRKRDELFARLATEGEWVPERTGDSGMRDSSDFLHRIPVIRKLGVTIRRFQPLGC
jgi:hypothetical protein